MRLLTYIYIDDPAHTMIRYARAYRVYQTCDDNLADQIYKITEEITKEDFEILFKFIKQYSTEFSKKKRTAGIINTFEMEMIRMSKYLLKYGITTYRTQKFIISDLENLFGFMCNILDIFTHRSYAKSQQAIDKINSKDMISDDFLKENPIMQSFNDIKYQFLNKKDWSNMIS